MDHKSVKEVEDYYESIRSFLMVKLQKHSYVSPLDDDITDRFYYYPN